MRKFIIHTRALPGHKGEGILLVEVEGQILSPMDDTSVSLLPAGEFYFRIDKPVSLHESHEVKQPDGSKKKTLIAPVYHSHAIYHSVEEARLAAEKTIRQGFDFSVRKGRLEDFSEKDIQEKLLQIEVIMLT